MARHKNLNWTLHELDEGGTVYASIQCALLMDIRDELQHLNATLDCKNFREIPATLRGIRWKLPARRKRKA